MPWLTYFHVPGRRVAGFFLGVAADFCGVWVVADGSTRIWTSCSGGVEEEVEQRTLTRGIASSSVGAGRSGAADGLIREKMGCMSCGVGSGDDEPGDQNSTKSRGIKWTVTAYEGYASCPACQLQCTLAFVLRHQDKTVVGLRHADGQLHMYQDARDVGEKQVASIFFFSPRRLDRRFHDELKHTCRYLSRCNAKHKAGNENAQGMTSQLTHTHTALERLTPRVSGSVQIKESLRVRL
ncbi:hypothetical protein IWX47DRAFT_543765 [Phyllosticta citricarpa]